MNFIIFVENKKMEKEKFIYWNDNGIFIGYLEKYPDYLTQGISIKELKENLLDIYHELTSGTIPQVRKVDELEIAWKELTLLKKIENTGCVLIRHGGKHDWYQNPKTKISQPVPRHKEINEYLAKHILKMLNRTLWR